MAKLNHILSIAVLSGLLLMTASHAAEVKYKSAMLRDPFIDPSDEKPVDDSAKTEAIFKNMQVQGVIVSGENKSAIINGTIYKLGSRIGLGTIKDIERDSVVILYNSKEIKLQYIKGTMHNEKKAK